MAGKRDKPEEIVLKLRQVEVLQGQGSSIADAVRQIGVTQQTYYRWRKEYWSAPIEWSVKNVSAWSASGLSGQCFPALVDGIPESCAV